MKDNKIAVVYPYFGEKPIWFDLFLSTCKRNAFIDFYFFVDWDILPLTTANTFFFRMNYEEYRKLISRKLGIKFEVLNAYKLCDFKPFNYQIHTEILSQYEFWGFGDIDLIFGDLRIILSKLKKYDIISTHADRVSGHFCVMRTKSKYSSLCFKIKDWQNKLCENKVYGLDEIEYSHLVNRAIVPAHVLYNKLFKKIQCPFYKYFSLVGMLVTLCTRKFFKECYTSPWPKINEKWKFDTLTGKIYNPAGKEIPYLHFLFFKKTSFLKTDRYWKLGFYKIPPIEQFRGQNILISDESICVE